MLYHKLIWVPVQILIASFLSCIHYAHIVLSLEKEKTQHSPFIMIGFSKNWYIYSRFRYKWGSFVVKNKFCVNLIQF